MPNSQSLVGLTLIALLASGCSSESSESSGTPDAAAGSGGASSGGGGGSGAASAGAAGSSGASGASSGGAAGSGGGAGLGGGPGLGGAGGAPPKLNCGDGNVLCVDDTPGPTQEFSTIQSAVDQAGAGDTVLVHTGAYAGFRVEKSGSAAKPLVVRSEGTGAVISSPGPTGDGVRFQNVSYVHVVGLDIQKMPQRCIAARGATPATPMKGLAIRNNRCALSEVEGFYLSEVSQSVVEGNDISGTGAKGDSRSHGIYLANAGSDDTVLRWNVIHDCKASESAGIHFNGDASVGGDGIISGALVDGNIIYANNHNGLNMDGVQNSVVQNNVIYGNAANGLRAYAIDGKEGPKGLIVANNLIHSLASGRWAIKLSQDLGGHRIFNNILLTENSASGAIAIGKSPGFASANNAVTNRFSLDGDSSTVGLSAWQNAGFGNGSITTTAATLFPTPGKYEPKAGASTIGKGILSLARAKAPAHATDGAKRPHGAAVDIGPYEVP